MKEGDQIVLLSRDEGGWWHGRWNQKKLVAVVKNPGTKTVWLCFRQPQWTDRHIPFQLCSMKSIL
jgi:hypothetical protein